MTLKISIHCKCGIQFRTVPCFHLWIDSVRRFYQLSWCKLVHGVFAISERKNTQRSGDNRPAIGIDFYKLLSQFSFRHYFILLFIYPTTDWNPRHGANATSRMPSVNPPQPQNKSMILNSPCKFRGRGIFFDVSHARSYAASAAIAPSADGGTLSVVRRALPSGKVIVLDTQSPFTE